MNIDSTPSTDDSDCPFLNDADTVPLEVLLRRAALVRDLTARMEADQARRKAERAARRQGMGLIIPFPVPPPPAEPG